MALASLLPERVDLSYVAIFGALGAMIGGLVGRIRRRLGSAVNVYEMALDGAFWGGLIGFGAVILSEALK